MRVIIEIEAYEDCVDPTEVEGLTQACQEELESQLEHIGTIIDITSQ